MMTSPMNNNRKSSVVYGHKCNDFRLSASDQSVIDMMKHYLHTSRKTECSDNKLSNTFKQIKTLAQDLSYPLVL
jgi:hypothetical protein